MSERPNAVRAEGASAGAQRQDAPETRDQAKRRGRGDDTKRLTASERDALMRLNVAFEIMALDVMESLAERMRMIPGARRDLAMMSKRITKIIEAVPGTIPDNQLKTYLNNLKMVSYTIGVKRPGKLERDEKNYGMWISFEVLNALLTGCHDHCLMCPDDKAERRACKLRKALETIPSDTTDREDGDCPFYTIL